MNLGLRLLASGLAAAFVGCGKPSASKTGMPRHEIEANLLSITGLKIPATATRVSGEEMTAFTHLFDCSFECSLADLKQSWEESTKLMATRSSEALVPQPRGASPVFDGQWPSQGGTQFVSVRVFGLDAGDVRVEIRTTHEDN